MEKIWHLNKNRGAIIVCMHYDSLEKHQESWGHWIVQEGGWTLDFYHFHAGNPVPTLKTYLTM